MHTLILTLALLLSSSEPARDALLKRFDDARARLALADLATLERAVTGLERLTDGSAVRDGDRDHSRHDGGQCLTRMLERFQRRYDLDASARRARESCAAADFELLDALITAFEQRYDLDAAVQRARETAADSRMYGKAAAFAFVQTEYARRYDLDAAVQRTRELLAPLSRDGAACVVRLYPTFSGRYDLDAAMRRATETCATP